MTQFASCFHSLIFWENKNTPKAKIMNKFSSCTIISLGFQKYRIQYSNASSVNNFVNEHGNHLSFQCYFFKLSIKNFTRLSRNKQYISYQQSQTDKLSSQKSHNLKFPIHDNLPALKIFRITCKIKQVFLEMEGWRRTSSNIKISFIFLQKLIELYPMILKEIAVC